MKILFLAILLLASAQAGAQNRAQVFNVKNNVALNGYDPVTYFKGKPLEGSESYSYSHKGIIYLFTDSRNRAMFIQEPEKYEPAYGGWCAYAMGETGEKVKVDPETFKIIDGRLYLFYNFWGNNTLTSWNKNERTLRLNADKNWKKIFH